MAGDAGGEKSSETEARPSGTPAPVFVSYASQDADTASTVVKNFEQFGIKCWIAPRDVTPGSQYADEIVAAINDTKVFVLVLSENAVASSHVGREIERAASKRRRIIVLRTDSAPLTRSFEYFLSESQWIDVAALGVPAALTKLTQAVRQRLAPSSWVSPGLGTDVRNPADRKRKPSYLTVKRVIAAAVFLAVTALVVGVVVRYWPSKQGSSQTSKAAAIAEKSIAVLPFVDMSEKKDQEYFSDGLSEELIDMLTKVPELRVPARTSSFYFKGKQATIADIAKALGVAHVLEGSVRKSGNTLRITAQLIRVDNGYHVWSETYDRKLDDIFKIQDDIADAVVMALRVHLLPVQQPSAQEEPRTGNIAAYNLYLQGKQSYNQGDTPGYQRAITAFQAATVLDPHYAAAYADLALAQFWLTDDGTADTAGYEKALAAAEKAVALAPGMAAGYSARGFVRAVYRFDFAGGQADLDKAITLSPSDARALHRSAVLLGVLGDLPAAIGREEKALALDPLSEEICRRLGFFFVANQQFAQAHPLYEKALAIAPNSAHARYNEGMLHLLESQPEQALAAFRQTGIEVYSLNGQAKAEYSLRHVEASRQALETLIAKYGKASPWMIAEVYAWRGETNSALEWAEHAYEQRDDGITWLKINVDFRGMRDDPRYKALLKKMNLPEG
jgi:TolB-like protein/Flp pilus assembly protein TadD